VRLVLSDGRTVKAKTMGQNVGIDSGLIKITEKGKWPFVPMGKSKDLKKGQWVLAVGHPGGLKGNPSGKEDGRTPVVRLGQVMNASKQQIATDCTLVGGDSGGPLFDMKGFVVGIHSQIRRNIDTNIHVPVDTYRETWDRLVKGDSWGGFRLPFGGRAANQPYMGLEFQRDSDELKLKSVRKDFPAEKAGLMAGDVFLKFNGVKVTNREELQKELYKKKPGDEVTIEIKRGDKTLTIKVKLTKRPDE